MDHQNSLPVNELSVSQVIKLSLIKMEPTRSCLEISVIMGLLDVAYGYLLANAGHICMP